MKPKVSVIVPIYNTKQYITKCIESILDQTMKEIEILLIDDGSTDGSEGICDLFAKKDKRIKTVHTVNKGVASARNKGIQLADAEYIMFVDSDDWVEEDYCKHAYDLAKENNADMVIFGVNGYLNGQLSHLPSESREGLLSAGIVDKTDVMRVLGRSLYNSPCNKIIRKELFSGIIYPEGHCYEDLGTTYKLVNKSTTIVYSNEKLYNVRMKREGSITTEMSRSKKEDLFLMWNCMNKDISNWGYDCADFELEALSYMIFLGMQGKRADEYMEVISKMSKPTKDFSSNQKIMFYLLKYCPTLFNFMCTAFGRRIQE